MIIKKNRGGESSVIAFSPNQRIEGTSRVRRSGPHAQR